MADIFISLTKTPNLEEQSRSPFFTTKWQKRDDHKPRFNYAS